MRRGFDADKVWKARGRGFSMGCIQPAGQIVHLTGQVAWDDNENLVGLGDVSEQTRQCFRNIERLLAAVGGSLHDIVSITTYYLEHDHLAEIQAVRNEFLDSDDPPVSTSVRVAGLGHPDFLVELTPIAVLSEPPR